MPLASYSIGASALDLDRQFALAAQRLGDGDASGLAALDCHHHGGRDMLEVKVELIVLLDDAAAVARLEARAAGAFNAVYDAHTQAIGERKERGRQHTERLRVASARSTAVAWRLPTPIDFRRPADAPAWPRHLDLKPNGQFRATLPRGGALPRHASRRLCRHDTGTANPDAGRGVRPVRNLCAPRQARLPQIPSLRTQSSRASRASKANCSGSSPVSSRTSTLVSSPIMGRTGPARRARRPPRRWPYPSLPRSRTPDQGA